MNHKFLIIALSVLLIVCLVFGYGTLRQSFGFVENTINTVGDIGNSALKLLGMDLNTSDSYFIPIYGEKNYGSYIDSNGNLQSIDSALDSLIPNWLRNRENDLIVLQIYPTFYSGNIQACYTDYATLDSSLGFLIPTNPIKTIYSTDRIIRLHATICTTKAGVLDYDIYVWKDKIDGTFCYFVTYKSTNVGYFSKYLNTFSAFEKESELDKKLNSSYIEPLGKSSFLMGYNYDMISNVQNTNLYIEYNFDEFFN